MNRMYKTLHMNIDGTKNVNMKQCKWRALLSTRFPYKIFKKNEIFSIFRLQFERT